MSQPSSHLDVFWLKLVVFWNVTPVLRLCEPLSYIFNFFFIHEFNLVVVLRASDSLRCELRRVAVEYILYVCASVVLQGLVIRRLDWKRSVFRGNSVRFVPEFR